MKLRTLALVALLGASAIQAQTANKIIGNPESHVYHVRCVHVATCKKCTAIFATEDKAKAAGYHICPFAKKAAPAVKP